MTDDAMKELVTKHDTVIEHLVTSNAEIVNSVKNLVEAQKESNERQMATNARLEEISKFLAKQVVFSTKLESMDKEVAESFTRRDIEKKESDTRIHKRIDEVELLQKSSSGCQSVMLLKKDVDVNARDVTRLIGDSEEHRIMLDGMDKKISNYPSNKAIVTAVIFVFGYMVVFGTYVVQSIGKFDVMITKLDTTLKNDISDIVELKRKMK